MTTPNIANQPHVICFVSLYGKKVLQPCTDSSEAPGLHHQFAIYATRAEADSHLHLWEGAGYAYFSVPAEALFDVEIMRTFTLRA